MTMFGGINPKTLLSTPEEWHALVIGFCVGFCPWIPKVSPLDYSSPPLNGEEHYFVAGIVPGFIALLRFLVELAKLIKEVLL